MSSHWGSSTGVNVTSRQGRKWLRKSSIIGMDISMQERKRFMALKRSEDNWKTTWRAKKHIKIHYCISDKLLLLTTVDSWRTTSIASRIVRLIKSRPKRWPNSMVSSPRCSGSKFHSIQRISPNWSIHSTVTWLPSVVKPLTFKNCWPCMTTRPPPRSRRLLAESCLVTSYHAFPSGLSKMNIKRDGWLSKSSRAYFTHSDSSTCS